MNIDFNVTTFVESKNLDSKLGVVRTLPGGAKQNPSKTSAAGKKTPAKKSYVLEI